MLRGIRQCLDSSSSSGSPAKAAAAGAEADAGSREQQSLEAATVCATLLLRLLEGPGARLTAACTGIARGGAARVGRQGGRQEANHQQLATSRLRGLPLSPQDLGIALQASQKAAAAAAPQLQILQRRSRDDFASATALLCRSKPPLQWALLAVVNCQAQQAVRCGSHGGTATVRPLPCSDLPLRFISLARPLRAVDGLHEARCRSHPLSRYGTRGLSAHPAPGFRPRSFRHSRSRAHAQPNTDSANRCGLAPPRGGRSTSALE